VKGHGGILFSGRIEDEYFGNSIEPDVRIVQQRKKSINIVKFGETAFLEGWAN
jgi:hypothetical protein